jgi:glutamate-1-semialdehyde 2,1-aminomutase
VSERQATIDRTRLDGLIERERRSYSALHPRSEQNFSEARKVLLEGVPMSWMAMWPGSFPIVLERALGARLWDVDGHEYVDFCLGDTAAMAGHAPAAVAEVVERQYRAGATAMLPTADGIWVGNELRRRFGLEIWQFALSATDANRWMLRIARHVTDRSKVLVFSHNYHGTVDEVNLVVDTNGQPRTRSNNIGAPIDPRLTTKVIEWNDIDALSAALEPRDVACVLAEPALTNIGIVLPDPGYHEALRQVTRETGTLLIIDETHTFSAGPGGCSAEHQLCPDAITLGKAIAGGIPIGAYGMTAELAGRFARKPVVREDTGMIGGTLAGNALSLAAAKATLKQVLTDDAFTRMVQLATLYVRGMRDIIATHQLPWHITQLGARAEFRFCSEPPRNGGASAAAADQELDAFIHLFLINRAVVITPFHNMALTCPATTPEDVDRLLDVMNAAVDELVYEAPDQQ